MGKPKATKTEKPAGPERAAPPERPGVPSVGRDFLLPPLMVLLGLAATAYIWLESTFALPIEGTPSPTAVWEALKGAPAQRMGLALSGLVWMLVLIGLLGRSQARRTARTLQAILAKDEIVRARLESTISEEQSGIRMRHVSAWLVLILGACASGVVWHTGSIEGAIPGFSTLVVGVTVSVCLALAVAANAINRLKTRRLTRDFRAAMTSERLAVDTLGALDVMTSSCLPTGERTRFSERFVKFLGRTEAQLQGHGWLESVHPDDRQSVLEIVSKPLTGNGRNREQDVCVRHREGNYVWIHETLSPRFDQKGELIEFICTAVNITQQVENEAKLSKQIDDLKADLDKAQAELIESKNELSKSKTSRNRFESTLTESREEVKNLRDALNKAEAIATKTQLESAERIKEAQNEARDKVKAAEQAAEARIKKIEQNAAERAEKLESELKMARQEGQVGGAENKKLQRAFEGLQEEIGQLKLQESEWREQIARHIKEAREGKADASQAQSDAAAHRAKSERLTQKCQELEAALAAAKTSMGDKEAAISAAKRQAQQAGAAAAAEAERRMREVSAEALAKQLRKQLDGIDRMMKELLSAALDGPVQDAANNAAATVRVMSDLVDQALGGDAPARPAARESGGAARSFDIRRTAEGVRDMLAANAKARGATFEVEVAHNVKPLHGDELPVRTALMSLADAALQLVEDGTLVMKLTEGVSTAAHSTIRCELAHSSARVKNDALETALAIKSTDSSMPDAIKHPAAHQAAKAWQTIRALGGQHGYQLPEEGGFSLWFSFTLGRPAASAQLRAGAELAAEAAERAEKALKATKAGRRSAPAAAPTPGASDSATDSASDGDSAAAGAGGEANGSRTLPRVPQESLQCSLGEVVELGADSMRVYCTKPPRSNETTVTLEKADLEREIRAEVMWSKRISGRKHDVGLKLLGLTSEDQRRILRVAMQHRKVTTMVPDAQS